MEHDFECKECHLIFKANLIMNDKNEVIELNPNTCPNCDCNHLIGRFNINPSNWVGVTGSNG